MNDLRQYSCAGGSFIHFQVVFFAEFCNYIFAVAEYLEKFAISEFRVSAIKKDFFAIITECFVNIGVTKDASMALIENGQLKKVQLNQYYYFLVDSKGRFYSQS